MYAETGAAMRAALAELLRQHRTQHLLGATPPERAASGYQIRQYRHTVLAWCCQTLDAIRPVTFSNQPPTQPNPFRPSLAAGPGAASAGELAHRLTQAEINDSTPSASLEQLTTPADQPHVELWRQVARAAALAEHDTAPAPASTMTASQAQALVADVAAITQALVVLDQRHGNTPDWQHLAQPRRLGWAALAAAVDMSLGQPDYTVDRVGWRPRVKPIPGPARPGILGVLQAEHNLAIKLGSSLPSTINLRYVFDSQRLVSRHLVPFAARIDGRLAGHWNTRADTYADLQRQFRRISGVLGAGGGSAAAEGANAVARLRRLPADTVVEPRVLGGVQLLFDRLDQHIVDLVEEGVTHGAFAQRTRLHRPAETDDLTATAREQLTPVDPMHDRDLIDTVRRLIPRRGRPISSPGATRADLHAAIVHRTSTRDPGVVPQL